MKNAPKVFISLGYENSGTEGTLKVTVGPPDSSVSVFPVGEVVDSIMSEMAYAVAPLDEAIPFVLSDDGAQTALWMRHQHHQNGQFLAATMASGGMFDAVLRKQVVNSLTADAALVDSPEKPSA